ncbi:hypothetical protein [Chloroflexus aggregans]|nr:hypothetical protein [Chloroflexus aggregans]
MKPWREAALARGLRSSAALPLHSDGHSISMPTGLTFLPTRLSS